ncbi:MAG: DUF4212 domain-containing protein [Planctomycetota bacterium]
MSDSNLKAANARQKYWRTNIIVIFVLLAIWCTASCFCSILFIEELNNFKIGNLPFGFWMANQGAMLTFVVLILIYAVIMDQFDRKYKKSLEGIQDDH